MNRRERQALRLLIDEARRERATRDPDVGRKPYWRAYYAANRERILARKKAHNAPEAQKGGRL